jgi:hypothetical protein
MAGLRKDVELIFRGTDRASPTIKGVRQEVAGLTGAIQEQIAAASRGEGSVEGLAKAYKDLQAAQGDVTEIAKLATAYESLAEKHAKAATAADEARQKEAQLTAQVAGAESPTKRLINQRDAATRAASRAAEKEQALAAQVAEAGAAFEAAGGDMKNFAASQEAIRQSALETARALQTAGTAMDNFKSIQAGGLQQKAGLAEQTQFNQLAAGSGLPQAQIAFISQMENRVQALSAAMKEAAASKAAWDAELQSRATEDAAARVRAMATALDEADQAQQRLAAATAFKNQAAGIEAAARDVERFGASMDTAAGTARRFAQSIDAILNPTSAATRTLAGVEDVIGRAEATMDGAKRRLSEYNVALNDLQAASAGLIAVARDVDAFRAQEAAVQKAQAAFDAAQADVLQYAAAIRNATEPTQEMANALRQAEGAMESAGGALQRENTRLAELSVKLKAAGIDIRDVASAEKQLEGAAQRAAAAQDTLRKKTGGSGNFLGLNPTDLTNLGYQVNDIIVGLASGQKPLTVLIQQGFQIGQLFPGILGLLAEFAPLIAAIGAPLIVLGAAIAKVADDSARLSNATMQLKSMGEVASGVDAARLAEVQKKLEDIGVEAKNVTPILRQMMAEGLNIEQMNQWTEAAAAGAKVTGQDFKGALDQLREGLSGGYDDVLKLQDATGVYTDAEMKLIEQLFEQGRADEARASALEIYNNRMATAAANSDGPWSRAIDNLGQAWNRLVSWIANSGVIQTAAGWLDSLGRTANYWAARLAGKTAEQASKESAGQVPRRQVQLPDPNRQTAGGQKMLRDQQEALAGARAVTTEQKRQIAGRKALNAAIAAGASNREAEQIKATAMATFDAQEGQRSAKRGAAAAKRRASAAATAARQIQSAEEQLQRNIESLDSATAKTQTESLQTRLSAIDSQYAKLYRDLDAYSKKTNGKGMVGDQTIAQARAHVDLQVQTLKNYAQMDFQEKAINELLAERKQKLDEINDKVARGIISPEDGLVQSNAVIDDMAGKIEKMAQDALAFAVSLRGATPNPQLEAFIAKMQTTIQNNSGGQNVALKNDTTKAAISQQEAPLNNIISQRTALIQRENTMVELGLQTRSQAQKNIMGFYQQTAPLVEQHIAQIRRMADAFKNSADPAMQLYYQSLMAHLDEVSLQAQGVDQRFVEMKNGVDQLLTTNIIGFINDVASAFADLVTGKGDVLDFFGSIGIAFAQMISKTLAGIAQLILQAIILNAVDKMTGGLIKPLMKMMYGGGVFHDGGIAGSGNRRRSVSPLIFAGAPRYHTGGIAGLAPDEMGAVLKKGEEVLTQNDPRHRANGGLSAGQDSGGQRPLRQVLAFGDDQIAAAMAGEAGEEVTVTHIRRNKARIRQELGI